jgi:transposase-like protein
MKSRRKFTAAFKTKVTLEAIRERESLSVLSSKYQLSQEQISKWKHEFLEKAESVFTSEKPDRKADKEIQKLNEIIGVLHVENEFLKKNL